MKILYYKQDGELLPGIVTNIGVLGISSLLNNDKGGRSDQPLSLNDIASIKRNETTYLRQAQCSRERDLEIGPCIPRPPKIVCIGLNYRKHAIETNMEIPRVPIVFSKYSNTLTDFGADIPLGGEGKEFDYEVELGVIMGSKCKNVAKEDALSHVLGYCVANDLSCRDLQFRTSQWLLGKSLDQFLPLGKYLVTTDEIPNPQNLELTCYLNGEIRQRSNTSDMIFTVAEIIAYLSRFMTLEPGDLILTGTPSGVIMGLKERIWLKPGDVVRVEIEGLGYTENKMIHEYEK